MTAGRAALVELMRRHLGGLLDPSVCRLEVHKLMYFMQEAGEPLRLRYSPAAHGPYAGNLRHVLQEIEGHFVSGYRDGGDAPGLKREPVLTMDDSMARLYAWNARKRQFTPRQVALAAEILTARGWVPKVAAAVPA